MHFFKFQGRINRITLFVAQLIVSICFFALFWLFTSGIILGGLEPDQKLVLQDTGLLIIVVTYFILSLSLSIRRLHDMNLSGWIGVLVLAIFTVIYIFVPNSLQGIVSSIPSLWLLFWKGTNGSNKYGMGPMEFTRKIFTW